MRNTVSFLEHERGSAEKLANDVGCVIRDHGEGTLGAGLYIYVWVSRYVEGHLHIVFIKVEHWHVCPTTAQLN
jgi:hypothetical protein